jgi:predicted RNA binding protein YcfA (HicA-like mRNA interferase family)
MIMREWDTNDFIRMLKKNGYTLNKNRGRGGHSIYQNSSGNHISVPLRVKAVIARRLIKENNLNINL